MITRGEMVERITTGFLSPQKNVPLRRNFTSKLLMISIASSILPSSRAFVSQRQTCGFDRILPTPSRDLFAVTSNVGLYMSTAEIENPTTRNIDEEDTNVITLKGSPSKAKMPVFEANGPVTAIQNTQHFLHLLETAPKDGLVVIKYHAKFCKVCARVILKFKKMAHKLTDGDSAVPIIFADVELTTNTKLCSTLEIKKFPYLQIYRNMECVASFGTGPAHNFQRAVGGTIQDRLATTDTEWENIRATLKEEIADGQEQLRLLRLDVEAEDRLIHVDTSLSSSVSP